MLEAIFLGKSRAEWCELLEGSDCCFAPVLSPEEAKHHPHNVARGMFNEDNGLTYPAAAPRLPGAGRRAFLPQPIAGADSAAILRELGFDTEEMKR